MDDITGVENKFFESSPYKTQLMSAGEFQQVLTQLRRELHAYDILHIQHEFAFFRSTEFSLIVDMAKSIGKKVVVTVHTSPDLAMKKPRLRALGPRSLVGYLRDRRNYQRVWRNHIAPFMKADLLLVHNNFVYNYLLGLGVEEQHIRKIAMPVYNHPTPAKSTVLAKEMHKKADDIIYCAVGFLHRYKGLEPAVKALKFLPDNYKLAIIGGVKADSDDIKLCDNLCDLIDSLNLQDRVYITGYIEDDLQLDGMIRECDISIYPYDKFYYARISSASLSLAFGNNMPTIAYPTETFREINDPALILCESFSYYELARELGRIDIPKQAKLSHDYAERMGYPKMAHVLVALYRELLGGLIAQN
jgi:glycosyltransferase involved in cell wall biosynthesis